MERQRFQQDTISTTAYLPYATRFVEIWKEWNARVFRNVAVPVGVLVARIKDEAAIWRLADAKISCRESDILYLAFGQDP